MANLLIAPSASGLWRVDTEVLGTWLEDRWPGIDRALRPNDPHRATSWTWPDLYEMWVPADRTHAWIAADRERTAAIAAHLGASANEPLVLCDETYSFDANIHGESEAAVLARLRDT